MSENRKKPSPGPWSVGKIYLAGGAISVSIKGKNGAVICLLKHAHDNKNENADFIVAAWEMAELLRELELLVRVNAPLTDGSPVHKKILETLKKAGAV